MPSALKEAARGAVASAQTNWATARLRHLNPRFTEVWQVAGALPGWFEEVSAAAIFQVMSQCRPRCIVEIGSYLGKSTVFFGQALKTLAIDGYVVAVDPHSGDRQQRERLGYAVLPTRELFEAHVRGAGLDGIVRPIVTTSQCAAANWDDSINLLFIDGWHSYDAVLEDVYAWTPHLSDDGVIILDDVYQYAEVRAAVSSATREGVITPWGRFFGQLFAGLRSAPPASVKAVLRYDRPLTRLFSAS